MPPPEFRTQGPFRQAFLSESPDEHTMNTKHAILISMTKICKKDNRRNAIEGQDFL